MRSAYVFGPWHPPFSQFAVACSILAAFIFWIGNNDGQDWALKAAGFLWVLTFIAALSSLLTGHFFAHRLGRYSPWTFLPPTSTGPLHFHALLETIAFFLSLSIVPFAFHLLKGQPVHGYTLFFLGIAAAVFFGWGAHEGGEMTYHMEMVPLAAPQRAKSSNVIHLKTYRRK